VCCRDGNYKESKHEQKTAKTQLHPKPSRKLNDVCISRICVTKLKINVIKYVAAHSNHTPGKGQDAFLPLPASTKEEIAMKLSLGISDNGWYLLYFFYFADIQLGITVDRKNLMTYLPDDIWLKNGMS